MQTTFPGRPVQEVICSQHLTNNMHDYNLTKNNDEKNNNKKNTVDKVRTLELTE